jgi:hypothetical protein
MADDDVDVDVDDDDDDADLDAGGGAGDDDDDDEDDDYVRVPKSQLDEFNRLKREQAESAKQRRKAEAEAKKAREQAQRESGNYDELLGEKDTEVQEAAARAEAAEYQLEQFQRTQRISSIANRLGFKDSEDAVRFLDDDDSDDDVTAERALKRLAREKPYLVDTRRSTGAPVGGEGSTLSMEEIKRMTPDEVNARWEEVQQAMQNQPAA